MNKTILVLAFALFASSSLVFAKTSELDQLNLTTEQKTQIKTIRKNHLQQVKQEIDAVLTTEQKTKRDQIKAQNKATKKNQKLQNAKNVKTENENDNENN